MSLLEAKEYDPRPAQRRRNLILYSLSALLLVGALLWVNRNYLYERQVKQFMSAVQSGALEQAYGIWIADPNWKQQPQKYDYTFGQFENDWGPSGEWGRIQSFDVEDSVRYGSGVIVVVRINGRSDPAFLWVERKDRSMTWSPYEVR